MKNYFCRTNKFIKRESVYKNVFIDECKTDSEKLKFICKNGMDKFQIVENYFQNYFQKIDF